MTLKPNVVAHFGGWLLGALLSIASMAAPSVPLGSAPAPVSQEVLDSKIKEAESSAELDETTKAKLIELYRKTATQLEKAKSNAASAEVFTQAMVLAPEETSKLRAELKEAPPPPTVENLGVSSDLPLAELEQTLVKQKADLSALEAKLADLEKQLQEQSDRPNAIRTRLPDAKQELEGLAKQLDLPPVEGEPPQLTQARRWMLQTRERTLSTEIDMLDKELLSQPTRVKLLEAQRDRTARSAKNVGAAVRLLAELVNQRRLLEAQAAEAEAAEAQLEAAGKHPLIRELTESNALLTREFTETARELERISAAAEQVKKKARQLEDDFRSAKQQLEIAGLSPALGRLLLDARRNLPSLRGLRREMAQHEERMGEAGLRQLRHRDERRRLGDIDAVVTDMLAPLSASERTDVEAELRKLLEDRRKLLDQARANDSAYMRAVGDLDFAQRRFADAVAAYDRFLAKNLLWLRGSDPFNLATLRALPGEVGELLSPAGWIDTARTLWHEATQSPFLLLVAVVFGVLVAGARRLRTALRATGSYVGKVAVDRWVYTLQALGLTVLIAAPWPLLVGAVGLELQLSLVGSDFTKAVGFGALTIASAFWAFRAFTVLCERDGVADRHFTWPEKDRILLRRSTYWLTAILIPGAFVAGTSSRLPLETTNFGLSRVAFVVILVALAVFFRNVFSPKHGVTSSHIETHPRGWLARLRHLWFATIVGAPLGLALLTLLGYYHTAGILSRSLVDTLFLLVGLVIVHDLVIRWLALTRAKLAYQAVQDKFAAALAEREAPEEQRGEAGMPAPIEEPELDLAAVGEQTRKLLNTVLVLCAAVGLWLIWREVLPALRILDEVSLWQQTVTVAGEDTQVPVTLGDIGIAVIIGIITAVAARNLPAVLEFAVLQRTSLTSGSRYAISTLLRYSIVGIGIVVAIGGIGGSWSQIQWLVAALGVGIGFGLQEIVANFISGIIILFERPIRVGDVVTVADTTGVVSRIQIRATTIRNWDRQELLVPNKEFITGRLLNWTLSDQTTRVVIKVGIAYGSDVAEALRLLAEAAEEHERVLDDPAPLITFEGFGDNALALVMRCYLASIDYRLRTISELHEIINRKFNDAGIVIAFPQRDIHLDTLQPLDIRIHPSEASNESDNPR